LVDGKAESHEDGIYYLRCLRDGKGVREYNKASNPASFGVECSMG
jgi:hypothetical protein